MLLCYVMAEDSLGSRQSYTGVGPGLPDTSWAALQYTAAQLCHIPETAYQESWH